MRLTPETGGAFLLGALFMLVLVTVAGCASVTCQHNPRSMQCMSADDLVRELSRPIP